MARKILRKAISCSKNLVLNNDQRRQNVVDTMGVVMKPAQKVFGPYVLFDDYTGSGATFKEAARALRKEANVANQLFPFALAAVRWKLGSPGMV